ncbi:hypothetical protein HOY80DRAFT_886937, partial [Tuber brumale]
SVDNAFVRHHATHSSSVAFNMSESISASTARQVSAGVESQSHSGVAGLAGGAATGIMGGLLEGEGAHKTEEEQGRAWGQEGYREMTEVGHMFGKEELEEQRKGEERRAFEISRIQKEQHERVMYEERVRKEAAEQEAREMGQLIYEKQEAERLRKSQEERRIQLDLELQQKHRDEEALELQRIQLTLARERENETIRRIEQARQEDIARKERLAKEERSRREEQEHAAEYRRRMEMEREKARVLKFEEEQRTVMALQLKREEDEKRIQLEKRIAWEREQEREVRGAEEKRRMATLLEMRRLEEVELERRMLMGRERSKQLREQALQRAQCDFETAREAEEKEKRRIQIQIEAERDLQRKRLEGEDEKRQAEHCEKKRMEGEVARQLHAQAEAEKLGTNLQNQQKEERRLNMEEEMARTLQAQIEAQKVREDQQKRGEEEGREYELQLEERKRTIVVAEAERRDAGEFRMKEQEIQLEHEQTAEEERLIQMEVDRRLAAERAEQARIELEAKAAELKAQMAVLAAQQKEAREARRRKRKADPNYREREVSRNRERSRERETEREKARREQVEMIRKNAGLDEKPSKSKRSVSFAQLPTEPVEFIERSWTVPGGVPMLVQTAPTPPPGTPKAELLIHVDPSTYFPPTGKEKEGESSREQSGAKEPEGQRLEIGSPEVVVASPPPHSPEVGFSTLDKEIAVGTPFTGIPLAPQPNNAIETAETTAIAIGITEESQETREEQQGRQRSIYYGPVLPEGYQFPDKEVAIGTPFTGIPVAPQLNNAIKTGETAIAIGITEESQETREGQQGRQRSIYYGPVLPEGYQFPDKEVAIGTPFTGIPLAPQPNNAIKTAETVIAIGITEESQEAREEQRGHQRSIYYGPVLPEGYQFRSARQESFYGPELPTNYYFPARPGPSVPVAEPVSSGQSPPLVYGPRLPDNYKSLERSGSGSSEEGRFHSPAEFTEVQLEDYSKPTQAYGMIPCDLGDSLTANFFIDEAVSGASSVYVALPTGGTMDNTPTATTCNTPVSRQNAQDSREGSRSVTPTPPSRRFTEERKQEDREFTAIAMAAAEDAGFNPGLVLGEAITATPEATKPPTPVDQRSVEEEERKPNRSRSMSRIPEVLRSGSRSKSRRQRTGSLFGRSKTFDSVSSDSRADSMTPGSGGVSLESSPPTLERRSTDTARKMSLTANVLSSMKILSGGGDKSHPHGVPGEVERRVSHDQSPNTPQSTPPASIMDGWLPGRRSRKSSLTYHSDDSQMLEETERLAAGSSAESKKERKERIDREKKEKKEVKEREKREKKEEKERSSGEAGSPESGKSRWGGLFNKLGVKQATPATSPPKPALARVVQRAMDDAATKNPPPTRSGSDEGETHTRPTTSSGRSFRSFAGVFGGGKSDHHATDSASAASSSIHNESLTSQDLGRTSFDAGQLDHAESRMAATFSGLQEEVSSDGVHPTGGWLSRGTIEISDQAGIQAGEKKKRGIPVPPGGLRRGRSAEFAELIKRGSLDERGLPSPIPELSEGRNSWRNSRDIGMSLDQVAGINRADARTPEQIPLPTPDANEDQEFRGPETRIPQPSTSSSRLTRKKKTVDLAAASSESIDSLPEQHQSGDVNETEVRMESRLPQLRRTESLKVKTKINPRDRKQV